MSKLLSFNSNLVRLKEAGVQSGTLGNRCFNSNLVRLKGILVYDSLTGLEGFNSNLVRLKERAKNGQHRANVFQFQSGTIKGSRISESNARFFCCFNSNLVRLKEWFNSNIHRTQTLFQFQSGTIKGQLPVFRQPIATRFQFQSGTIKGQPIISFVFYPMGFNSNLVRLKVIIFSAMSGLSLCFNSNLVRLKDFHFF